MAYYAALVSLVQLLKDITDHNHPYSAYVFDKQQLHLSLYEKFNLLQELLDIDYSPKEESTDLILESRIRDAACDAQDIIEFHVSDLLSGQIRICFLDRDTTREEDYLQKKYYENLEKVKAEVDSIVEEMVRIKMESLTTQEEGFQRSSYISADNFGGVPKVEAQSGRSTMVVFDEEFMTTIKAQLYGEPSTLEVVSIVGMGGLGKTTLARNIFDSKLIDDHFDCRAWVTVSQDYHKRNTLLAIVDSLNPKKGELREAEENVIVEHIYKHLFGRRYLIILDDVWDTKVWNDIKRIFPDTSNKSRIMLTTRLSDVALFAGNPNFLHQMQFLNENQSWTLLQQKVFGQEHCPEEVEAIGKLIAENCRGLPLGIVVIAGVLSNVNKTQRDWEKIARHVSYVAIDQNDKHLTSILSLSYNHLPHHLKPCFLYLGGFPEDHDILISQLIRLWVAEGFLKPIESKSLEEVGEEYLKDLGNRNLVSFTKKKFGGKYKYCSIHDLLRDLCSQRTHYENFLHRLQEDNVDQESIGNVRRLFASENSLFLKYVTNPYSPIRSVISFTYPYHDFLSATANSKLLRILDAAYWSIEVGTNYTNSSIDEILANEVFELLHLRYLTLKEASNIHIPPSICKLWNLQTLIVLGILVSLPSEIWKMSQLRHLILGTVIFRKYLLGGNHFVISFPPIPYGEISIIDGVPLLGRLQTLQGIYDFIFTRHTIEMIPSLKKLAVYYKNQDEDNAIWEEVGLNNLVHLHQLEKLEIRFALFKPGIPLLENFAFPSSLTKLTLFGCKLPWKEMRVVGPLPNLQVLKLSHNAFVGEEWEPIERKFLKLKLLLMVVLYDLKYWRAENIHFPCLEQLHIECCDKLEEIPSGIADIPTLQFIAVYGCNSAVRSSALKIQEEQRDQGNDDFQVRLIPSTWDSEEEDDSSNSR